MRQRRAGGCGAGLMAGVLAILVFYLITQGLILSPVRRLRRVAEQVSGGDIAVEVCRRLTASAIRVRGEVEPGVPAAELVGGQGQGMRVVTKAGGFGIEEALIESILYLERGLLS